MGSTASNFIWGDYKALGRAVLDAIRMVRQAITNSSGEIDRWEGLSRAGGES